MYSLARSQDHRTLINTVPSGLTHMHLNGLCHMDISPENVLFVPGQFRFVLHDFGLATDSPQIEADALKPYDR